MKIVVLDGYTENPEDLSWGDLERLGKMTVYDRMLPELVVERIGDAEAILVNEVAVMEEVPRQCENIRYIGVLAMGYNVIGTAAASARGVAVYNIPSYGADAVGQYAITLLLKICHRIGHHTGAVKQEAWNASEGWCPWDCPLIELADKAMGIIGYGRIGRTTERTARALGVRVLAYEGKRKAGQEEELVSLEMLLAQSDVISLYCPLLLSTEGIIDRETIGGVEDGVILLSDSRGPLIVEWDLTDALNCGRVYVAGLDVVSTESIRPDNPLFEVKNCLITLHIAWAPKENRQRLMNIAMKNLRSSQTGKPVNMMNG